MVQVRRIEYTPLGAQQNHALSQSHSRINDPRDLSERRFGMLVEGPLTPEEAAQCAPRVVARGLMPFKNKAIDWVAQLRVAQALVPLDGTDAQVVIEQLGVVLATVPPDSKRAVFLLHE